MTPYRNLGGNSGVTAYSIGETSITIRFKTGGFCYVYDYGRPGAAHVEQMKLLAERGKGLATYISQHVREKYARKLP